MKTDNVLLYYLQSDKEEKLTGKCACEDKGNSRNIKQDSRT